MNDPLEIIDQAIRLGRKVTVRVRAGGWYCGDPLHIGPRSVWLVVANVDMFIPLDEIVSASATITSPAGS